MANDADKKKEPAVKPAASEPAATDASSESTGPYVLVRSTLPGTRDGGHPVALREVNAEHPEGEVFIAGPTPVKVALTSAVKAKLRDGEIEEVS